MAMPYIWGDLARANNDPTTIDEAIDVALQAHNDDPDAHLGPDQSLESHRASEIIDHRAESVVNDKLATKARRYIAIVDPASSSDFDTIQSAVDYALSKGGGDIYITPGTHYLSDDVMLPRTCGLYGNGDGESVILSDDATARHITIAGPTTNNSYLYYQLTCTTSSNSFTTDGGEDVFDSFMIGFTAFYPDMMTPVGVVADYDEGTTSGHFVANAAEAITNQDVTILSAGTFINGSNGCTIATSDQYRQTNFYLGCTILVWETLDRYTIVAIEDDGTYILDRAFDGTSGTYGISGSDSRRRVMNIEGLGFGDSTADVVIDGELNSGTLVITDCTINARNTAVVYDGISNLERVVLYCGAVSDYYNYGVVTARDCTFYAVDSSSYGLLVGTSCYVENCLFTTSGGTWLAPLDIDNYPCVIKDCNMTINNSLTWAVGSGSITSRGVTFINNWLQYSGSSTVTFTGRHWLITGNRFDRSSGGGVILSATCNYSIFAHNYMNGTPTNSGTGNTVVNNISTR